MVVLYTPNAPGIRLPRFQRLPVIFRFWIGSEEEFGKIRLVSDLILLLLRQMCIDVIEDLVISEASPLCDPGFELGQGDLAISQLHKEGFVDVGELSHDLLIAVVSMVFGVQMLRELYGNLSQHVLIFDHFVEQ